MPAPDTAKLETSQGSEILRARYIALLRLVERLHRLLLDVIKDELTRQSTAELTSVQALLIFNIGNSELTASELRTRAHYVGTNVSYHVRKLVEAGYLECPRAGLDQRSVTVSLTEKGLAACDIVQRLWQRQLRSLEAVAELDATDLETLNLDLGRLERFWSDHVRYRL